MGSDTVTAVNGEIDVLFVQSFAQTVAAPLVQSAVQTTVDALLLKLRQQQEEAKQQSLDEAIRESNRHAYERSEEFASAEQVDAYSTLFDDGEVGRHSWSH